jgi:hypothetical protein
MSSINALIRSLRASPEKAANELPKLLKVIEVQQKAMAFFMDTYPDSTQTYVISSEAIAECERICGDKNIPERKP